MRGNAALGVRMHLVRADLHFERLAFGADHRRVQRLVVIALGPRDVVVELARQRRPQRVHDAERGVAGGDVVDQHAQRADVVQRGELAALALHLLPDRIDVLGPAGDVRLDADLGQRAPQRTHRDRDEALAVGAAFVEQLGDAPVGVRLRIAEREVFELPLQLPDAEPVRQRRVDVGGELGQFAALLRRRS